MHFWRLIIVVFNYLEVFWKLKVYFIFRNFLVWEVLDSFVPILGGLHLSQFLLHNLLNKRIAAILRNNIGVFQFL